MNYIKSKFSPDSTQEYFEIKKEPVLYENLNNKFTTENTSVVYIGFETTIRGHLDVHGEVIINGIFEGTINASQLTIEKNGHVSGQIKADKIIVYGKIDQELISTMFIHIHSTGIVTGNVSYHNIEIEKGGKLEGTLMHINPTKKMLLSCDAP